MLVLFSTILFGNFFVDFLFTRGYLKISQFQLAKAKIQVSKIRRRVIFFLLLLPLLPFVLVFLLVVLKGFYRKSNFKKNNFCLNASKIRNEVRSG